MEQTADNFFTVGVPNDLDEEQNQEQALDVWDASSSDEEPAP